jgi:hypothetical protein
MDEFPRYWKGAYNSRLGLAVMRQDSATVNSVMVVAIMLPEAEAQIIANAVIPTLRELHRIANVGN